MCFERRQGAVVGRGFPELALADEHTKDELTAERSATSDRIAAWRAGYGVEAPDALRTMIDASLEIAERRERKRVIDTWKYTLEMRTLIRHAIRLYDDRQQFTAGHSPTADATSGEERWRTMSRWPSTVGVPGHGNRSRSSSMPA